MPMVAACGRGHARGGAVFRRIWAAYDDSDEGRAGFELAVEPARRSGARLTVIHIVAPTEEEESVDRHSADSAAPDLAVEACVICGHPPTALRDLLEWGRPDLVVAGTEGNGGPLRGWLGGLAALAAPQPLSRDATCAQGAPRRDATSSWSASTISSGRLPRSTSALAWAARSAPVCTWRTSSRAPIEPHADGRAQLARLGIRTAGRSPSRSRR